MPIKIDWNLPVLHKYLKDSIQTKQQIKTKEVYRAPHLQI